MDIKYNLFFVFAFLVGLAPFLARSEPIRLAQISRESFAQLKPDVVKLRDARLNVAFIRGRFQLPKSQRLAWIKRAAETVSGYFGRFPVPEAHIIVVANGGRGVQSGTVFGYEIPVIRLIVGTSSLEGDLRSDWKSVHEMAHLGFPNLAEKHLWLSEGLAVYVERISLVHAGALKRANAWRLFVRDMPHGLPPRNGQGLDGTTSWGSVYWGGTIYSLLVDIELRRRTNNRLGLQDALRTSVAAGATHDKLWPVDRALEAVDSAIGQSVLREFYERMGKRHYRPDLSQLWRQLGVRRKGQKVVLDDNAELAHIRKSIMTPKP
ncbi:MAG: hypothetical protein AAGB04_24255 [Pseudomonadota bacterium]